MAGKSRPRRQVNWYIREWMQTLQVRQAEIVRRTGWSPTTVSLLYNHQQDYSPKIIDELSRALNIAPHELLLHPDDAMAQRQLRGAALTIAADKHRAWRDDSAVEPLPTQRKAN